MRSESKRNGIIIGALLITIALMTVGYAALATTLTINGTAGSGDASWDISYKSITKNNTLSTTDAVEVDQPTASGTSATFNVTLPNPGSTIVYDDKTDGFYEDIDENDIDLRGEAELFITGKVTNNSPLELTLDPTAIDVNGNALKGIKLVSANTIKSNLTDKTPSDLKITLTKDANVNLKDVKFDGIKFKAHATSANATTLNKNTHTIKIENLKVNIVSGELSIDADSKKK